MGWSVELAAEEGVVAARPAVVCSAGCRSGEQWETAACGTRNRECQSKCATGHGVGADVVQEVVQ